MDPSLFLQLEYLICGWICWCGVILHKVGIQSKSNPIQEYYTNQKNTYTIDGLWIDLTIHGIYVIKSMILYTIHFIQVTKSRVCVKIHGIYVFKSRISIYIHGIYVIKCMIFV